LALKVGFGSTYNCLLAKWNIRKTYRTYFDYKLTVVGTQKTPLRGQPVLP